MAIWKKFRAKNTKYTTMCVPSAGKTVHFDFIYIYIYIHTHTHTLDKYRLILSISI